MFFLSRENLRLKIRIRCLKIRISEFAKRGSIKSICYKLEKAANTGMLDDKDVFKDLLETTARNFHRKGKTGHRYKTSVKEIYEIIMYWGGPRLASFVSMNLCGPEIHNMHRWRNKNRVELELGITEKNFIVVGQLYKEAIEKLGHLGKDSTCMVPVEACEDETAIIRNVTYCQESDELMGFCGVKGDDHQCLDNFSVEIGEGVDGYRKIVSAFEDCHIGSYARAILLNPLHQDLPKIPVLIMPTCNRFDHNFVYHQWDIIKQMYDKHLKAILGPLVGNSSDGDSRRRKLFVQLMGSSEGERFRPVPRELGFIFSCEKFFSEKSYYIDHLCDSDYIHCHKKLINHLDHNARCLRM